jgi:hypothetical protein
LLTVFEQLVYGLNVEFRLAGDVLVALDRLADSELACKRLDMGERWKIITRNGD